MSKFTGRQQNVGLAREATRGTLVTPTIIVPKTNFTVEDKAEKAKFMGNYGRLEGGDAALVTHKWAEGDLELELTDKVAALLMYAMFGSLSTGSFNSAYKHTLTVQQSVQPTTLSLWLNDEIGAGESPTKSLAYAMAMVNSLEIEVALGELVKAKVNFISKVHKDFARQAFTYAAENKFAHQHLQLRFAADTSGLSAAAKIKARNFKIRFTRDVVRENALGTVQPVDILARNFKIAGSLNLTYEDRTYRDYMLAGTYKAMRFALVNGDVAIGSTNPQIQVDLPYVHFESWAPSHPLDDVATQEINFEALFDVSNNVLVGANTFVVNSTASF